MAIVVYISVGIFGLVALLALLLALVRRWGAKVLARLHARMAVRGEEILLGDGFANFRGRLSDGYPLRGNAVLLLTVRALHVVVLWPRREIELALERMRRIEVTRTFMGRLEPRGFIILHFVADGGAGEDAIGFTVRGFADWVAAIIKAAQPHLQAVQGRKTDPSGPSPAPGAAVPPPVPVPDAPAPPPAVGEAPPPEKDGTDARPLRPE